MYGESSELDAKILQLLFKKTDISMLIILPKQKDGISALESKIGQVNLQDLVKTLQDVEVKVKLPKFTIESDISMNIALKEVSNCNISNLVKLNSLNFSWE